MSNIYDKDSCSCPDESELELGLGLILGGGARAEPPPYATILTAKDFTSSSSSSSPINDKNGCCGIKRAASTSPSAPSTHKSPVAGWPPVANYRMNTLVNNAKFPAPMESDSAGDKRKVIVAVVDQTNRSHERNNNIVKERGLLKKTALVKVNVDGNSIGRKIDLNAHSCYATLARTLDHMFTLSATVGGQRLNEEEKCKMVGTGQPALSLDGSTEFVLTYEDKDGDWMLVGDVPWEMFLTSVRRLRIRKTSEVNGPGTKLQNLMNQTGNNFKQTSRV